ncbi:PREDICTED: uncharacterized protein LOC109341427 isoform X2 [Lupinus angustifolius]|uniref:uncharacterized protein LOC109341427 isoform X2 n=1 Tax=Lupinus angustifolius TaxID=3871 RepID=UPI00092E4F92|nr:PREDICTED: uncharacterized protein LOC109341427 isoform X2 [Lupinus angustifolius]
MDMAFSSDHPFKSDSANAFLCSEKCQKKISKLTNSRDCLRKAIKIQEQEINRLKKECEDERLRTNTETEEKLKEYTARVSLENQVSSLKSEIAKIQQKLDNDGVRDGNESIEGLQACLADKEKEISELKELCEVEKIRAESERKNAEMEKKKVAEAQKLLEAERSKERETSELKEFFEAEKRRAESEKKNAEKERKKAAEAQKLLEAEKNNKVKEISQLKELLETEKKRAESERKSTEKEKKKVAEAQKLLEAQKNKEEVISELKELLEAEKKRAESWRNDVEKEKKKAAEAQKLLEAQKNNKEREISELMELFEVEKERFESEKKNVEKEKKNASEARKLLEVEKNKNVEKGLQIARVEAEKKMEEYRSQLGRLEKEVNETKAKLASKMYAFEEANKKFEAEKRKLLAEKRNLEMGMARANEKLEGEKQKANEERGRADSEVVNTEAQKGLAEDNWKKFMEEKGRADQMSQQLEEDKRTIEGLKQKITELSSTRESIEMAGVTSDTVSKAESTKMKLLKSQLKLEKLRVKNAKQNFKLEASRHNILRHELGRLKIDSIQLVHRLDMLDASFSAVAESTHDYAKHDDLLYLQNSNVMRQVCNLDLSQMRSQFENELRMQHILALSGGNYSESITGINSKSEPLVRGSNRTKLQSSAVNSSSESFSDGQMMGSQETANNIPVTASEKLNQEIFNARQSLCNPFDKPVSEHHRKKRKGIHDIANLSSQNLPDLHGLFDERVDKCLEGGREMLHNPNNLQEKNDRAHKRRKKSHSEKVDMVPQMNGDGKTGREKSKAAAYQDSNVRRHTSCTAPDNLGTTLACGDMICDAANDFDSIFFDKVADGNYMKLLELENAADEEYFKRAMDSPLSPSLPEVLEEDMFCPRTDLFPPPSSNASEHELVKLSHMSTPEKSRDTQLVEGGSGRLHNQLNNLFVVFSNIEDNSTISRIVFATKACLARCNLATQTGWEVNSILTAVKREEKLSQKEKASVLLTLMLFNFVTVATMTFGKLWDGNLFPCMNSYAEHICTVMSDPEARILLLENCSLQELLGLIEDFLIEGKVIVNNEVPAETLSDCDLRKNGDLDCATKFSSDVASSEQLVAGSIILASICAATNHFGFLCEASYDILRLCNWNSLVVLTILHIFAYLSGEKFFVLDNFRLMITVLKSLVMFLEGENLSVAPASCLPSIDQLHTEFCVNAKCQFLEGAEPIDIVACLLLEEIESCWLQGIEQGDLSDSRFTTDDHHAGQWSNQEGIQSLISTNCDVSCCLKRCMISATQPHARKSSTFCHLGDVLSLVELVANKMSWPWTDSKFIPQLLNMLKSCVEENFVIAIMALLGQLGRIGVIAGGYGDRGVENLRCNLFAYLSRTTSMKCLSLQIATATALFGLLPFDPESLFHTNISLPAYLKSVSDDAETLRKWFSGLDKDQQKLLSGILKPQ